MRALHLIGLRAAGGKKLRYYPTDQEPLVLPSWIPESDREIIIAFYQQILSDDLLPRIEVDWYRSLVDADKKFLANTCERHGSGEYLVVIKVRNEGVGLQDILSQPELQPFQHVVVASNHMLSGERLGRLRELTQFVRQTVEDLYDEMASELSLRADGNALVAPLVQTLLNPILVVETYNALVDVHAEGVMPSEQGKAVFRRILGRLLEDMSPQVAVVLAALILRGKEGLEEAVPEMERSEALTALRARMLIRNDRLTRWARLLEGEDMREVVGERLRGIARPRTVPAKGAKNVLAWLDRVGQRSFAKNPIRRRVRGTFRLIDQGQIGRARDELAALESELESIAVTDETRGDFWNAVGRLHERENRGSEAEHALRQALTFLTSGNATPARRSTAMHDLASILEELNRWREAEPLFREALRLSEEGGDTPTSRSITMHALACGLRDAGRWEEAEPLFREALRLKGYEGDTSTSRSITMHELARGLRDEGRWGEAEPLFREALRLEEEYGGTSITRGVILDHLARGLRDNHRWGEGEPLLHQAIHLKREGQDMPVSVGATMRELAYGLRMHGREEEAERAFGDAQRLLTDPENHPPGRHARMLRQYSTSLRLAGRADEAAEFDELAAKVEAQF